MVKEISQQTVLDFEKSEARVKLIGQADVARDKRGKLLHVIFEATVDNKNRTISILRDHKDGCLKIWHADPNDTDWVDKKIIKEIKEIYNEAVGKNKEKDNQGPPMCDKKNCGIAHWPQEACGDWV